MAGIIRVEHQGKPYVVIDRRPLEEARLSWAARGLLGYLLAKPDDWQVRVSDLCRRGDLGRDGIHRVLQQLQDFGYVRREQVRDARGRVAGVDYTVLEVPRSPGPGSPGPAKPDPVEPGTGEPEPADPPLPSNQVTKDPEDQVTTTTTGVCGPGHATVRDEHAGGATSRGGDGNDDDRDRRPRDADDWERATRALSTEYAALEYPPEFSAAETAAARRKLAGVAVDLAQQLLDELAGGMAIEGIRGSPLSYLRGLVARAKEGAFTPEAAVTVAAARERRRQSRAAVEYASRPPEFPPPDPNNPLVQRTLRLRDRARAAARIAESGTDP